MASHLTGRHLLGGVGLPIFLVVSLALWSRRPLGPDDAAELRARSRRLLIPWLFWSLLIGAWCCFRAAGSGGAAWAWMKPAMLLYGPEIHLWFLPFLWAATLAIYVAKLALRSAPGHLLPPLAFALGALALAACPLTELGWPIEQWGFSVPAVCLGFGIGQLLAAGGRSSRLQAWLYFGAFAALALGLSVVLPNTRPYVLRHVPALGIVTLAWSLPNPPDPISARLAPLMLGVYVLHPIVFRELVEPLLTWSGLASIHWLRWSTGFLAALAVVGLLRRGPLRQLL